MSVSGLDVWFKGGTSLSKGFGLIERFSEDLDLKLEPGSVSALPSVFNWKSEGVKATAERRAFFEQLPNVLAVPGCTIELEQETIDKSWRGANLRMLYPGLFRGELPSAISGNLEDCFAAGERRLASCMPRRHELAERTPLICTIFKNNPAGRLALRDRTGRALSLTRQI